MEEWITVTEVSELLKISERQVLNRIYNGQLEAKKDGKKWLINSSLSEPSEYSVEVPEISRRDLKKDDLINHFKEQLEHLKGQIDQKDQQIAEKDRLIEKVQGQLERVNDALAEASHRHDTVVMQMTKLLEYHQQPFWRKLFSRKALPGSIDEKAMDKDSDNNKPK